METKMCGVLSCGLPPGTTGIPVDEIGKRAIPATCSMKNPITASVFLACEKCSEKFVGIGLTKLSLT